MEEREEAPPGDRRGRTPWWVFAAVALVVAAVVGTWIGLVLGSRGSPLASSGAAGGRPTIVVATPAAAPAPSVSVVPSPSATVAGAVSVASSATYVVRPGDTLRSIAQDQYGDASQWPRIYDANRDVIGPDPDALIAGTSLTIPR